MPRATRASAGPRPVRHSRDRTERAPGAIHPHPFQHIATPPGMYPQAGSCIAIALLRVCHELISLGLRDTGRSGRISNDRAALTFRGVSVAVRYFDRTAGAITGPKPHQHQWFGDLFPLSRRFRRPRARAAPANGGAMGTSETRRSPSQISRLSRNAVRNCPPVRAPMLMTSSSRCARPREREPTIVAEAL